MVSDFGIQILPEHLKTPEVLTVLWTERHKISAKEELKHRSMNAPLNSKQARQLILDATGNADQADKVAANFVLESTRKQQ